MVGPPERERAVPATLPPPEKEIAPDTRCDGWPAAAELLGRGLFLRLNDGLFAFDVGLAALFVFVFIMLFAHSVFTLFAGCDFVCWHYEFLHETIQCLFIAAAAADGLGGTGLRVVSQETPERCGGGAGAY